MAHSIDNLQSSARLIKGFPSMMMLYTAIRHQFQSARTEQQTVIAYWVGAEITCFRSTTTVRS